MKGLPINCHNAELKPISLRRLALSRGTIIYSSAKDELWGVASTSGFLLYTLSSPYLLSKTFKLIPHILGIA
ncbi:hypothetical protein E2C01_077464 [Portunus trituberculatus]|uniref:Uncharacterized protein n=1 Tax=Portunus trituberculatus TaxID=210409 RepID=A0A5B7IG56_PORTR|nr:hypothetical protein [Portunus trituberculatus]